MEELAKLLSAIVSPGKDWGTFSRKILSTLLVASLGAYGFSQYRAMNESHWESLPLHVAIEKDDRRQQAQTYLDHLMRAHEDKLKGVWVYSWPDARTLMPVIHAGHQRDPMPIGYFQIKDATSVGQLVMERCAEIERLETKLTACPIMAENDAWGVVIFEAKDDTNRPRGWQSIYAALTHKLSHIIYQ